MKIFITNFKTLFCVLLIAHTIFAENIGKKINLEDIERDNLISERRSQSKEVLEGQHTEHLRPPSIHSSSNYEIQHENNDVSTNDITYAREEPTPENHQYETHQRNNVQGVQYVTLQPEQYQDEKEYESQPQSQSPTSQYRPVHEEGRTYSAPSRHSLASPIIPTPSATPSPYLANQPQYVYVQAGQQPTHQSQQSSINYAHQSQDGVRYAQGISYTQQQHQSAEESYNEQTQQTHQTEPEQLEHGGVTYVHQTQDGAAYSPQPQQYIQYVPYVSQGPDQQSFIMMVPLRNAHAYVQSRPTLPYTQQNTYSHHIPQVNPTVAYTAPAEENSVLHAPHSTVAPAITSQLQYGISSYPNYHSSQPTSHSIQYSPQVQIQQSVEFPSRHEYYHAPKVLGLHTVPHVPQYQSHFQPSLHYGSPQLDFFGAYNKQHSSLIDSYIPSSVILDRQRSIIQKNQIYQQPSSSLTNHISTTNTHGLNGYNTIAYSAPLGYSYNNLKRSPSVPVTTKQKPKSTKLSKV